jgi:hypothetical protein
MMNCILRREPKPTQPRRGNLRALLVACVGLVALALFWGQPASAQAVGPVYALPGTLTRAFNRSYDTILTIADGTEYGLVGQTPDIEMQIVQFRTQGSEFRVKVWGDRFAATSENDLEIIVVSSIQTEDIAQPTPTPAATPPPTAQPTPVVPVAVVTATSVNVRSGPGTAYPAIDKLVVGSRCTVTGRNQNSTWWQLSCAGVGTGWVFGELLSLSGPFANVPVVQVAPAPTAVPPAPTAVPPATFVNWRSSFFPNWNLGGTPALVVDLPSINFNWGTGSPANNIPSDNFAARFERTLDFSIGRYEISMTMDDGARLFIDDQLVMDAWNVGSSRTRTVRQVLSGPRRLRVEYFEASGVAQLELSIRLINASEVWRATYYRGQSLQGTPILARGEPRGANAPLDYSWGLSSPDANLFRDDWSARWVGNFGFEGGDYRFTSTVDDGIRVYIDGILILDRWVTGYHESVTNTFRNLGAGNHQITVEYYENNSGALIRLGWERIGGGDGGRPRDE